MVGCVGGVGDVVVNGVEMGGEIGYDGYGSRYGSGMEVGMKLMCCDLWCIDLFIIWMLCVFVMGVNSF